MRTVAFRCYTGPKVGIGHLMRCREMARHLSEREVRSVIMGPSRALRQSADRDLFAAWEPRPEKFDVEADARAFISFCRRHNSRHAVMDDYRIAPSYQRMLIAAGIRWLQQFDASRPWDFLADVLVNAGPNEKAEDYSEFIKNDRAILLFGPAYAVLRPEFRRASGRPQANEVRRMFMSFGGGDDGGLIERALDELSIYLSDGGRVIVVSGSDNPRNDLYRQLYAGASSIDFEISPPNVAELMEGSDLALLAGGTMSYEAAMCGLPFILVALAPNQLSTCEGWQERTGACCLGPATKLRNGAIGRAIHGLAADIERRKHIAAAGQKAVDGKGVERLVDALLDD